MFRYHKERENHADGTVSESKSDYFGIIQRRSLVSDVFLVYQAPQGAVFFRNHPQCGGNIQDKIARINDPIHAFI